MLDPDISTHAALRHLHRPTDPDDGGVARRDFLKLVGLGLGSGLVAGPGSSLLDLLLPGDHDPTTWAAGPVGTGDGILLVVGMYGGNDGLNTVVPVNDGNYYDQHGPLALPPGSALPLDADTGLHPSLTEFKRFWDAGQLAIVEGIGHTRDDFSHFNSMAKWMSGVPVGASSSGWVGRWLDDHLAGRSDLYAAAEIGSSLPLHMIGEQATATTVPVGPPDFGVPRQGRESLDRAIFAAVRQMAGRAPDDSLLSALGRAQTNQLDVAQTLAPIIPTTLPDTEIVAKLEIAARLINANLGFRVVTAGWHDFDSHAGQPDMHETRMAELNDALRRFFATLSPAWLPRVTVMTFSEFGRTSWANDGQGTDHGSSAPQFVLGPAVRGGFYGQRPSLAGLRRWERMAQHVDYRNYYGTIVEDWLGGDVARAVPGYGENLGIFTSGPPSGPKVPGAARSSFVSISPERIFDSRSSIGGAPRRVGPGETVKIRIAGAGSIPNDDVVAVAMNVTAIRPSAQTFMTTYPTGSTRPHAAALNARKDQVIANMTMVGVGPDGTVSLFNNKGTSDVTVDVTGYFRRSAGSSMTPLSPVRLLDSRTGLGVAKGKVRGGHRFSLQIAGRGGVPSTATTAVLNVSAIRASSKGYVTTWPSGTPRPKVSSLSYRRAAVVPNLVVCKIGKDGKIDIEASRGELHLIADVAAYFGPEGARLQPITPSRLLDTRTGLGADKRRIPAGGELLLTVAGRNGVPREATAVALNVAAIRPSRQTFITLYPHGEQRPTTSSLNPDPGAVSANLVIAKVGADRAIRIFNNVGDVDMVVDVTAYYV